MKILLTRFKSANFTTVSLPTSFVPMSHLDCADKARLEKPLIEVILPMVVRLSSTPVVVSSQRDILSEQQALLNVPSFAGNLRTALTSAR